MNKKIDLSGKWVSAFVQNNKLYNEQVVLEQKENFVSANMILNYNNMIWHYKFEGKIHKNIITGTYDCLDECDIESGTISLKIINDDFLYGVATYLSDDKTPSDVVQSPYALFSNTENKLGTLYLCRWCVGKEGTCCAGQYVDMPMLLPNEVEIISKNMKISKNDFCQIVSFSSIHNDYALKDLYQMKRQEKKEGCYFYRDNQCTIYDIRPIDCRIFPYDIKLEKDGNYYLVYLHPVTLIESVPPFSTSNPAPNST